jgi:hypothetical protein
VHPREIGQGYGLDSSGSESAKKPTIFITVMNLRASYHFAKFLSS